MNKEWEEIREAAESDLYTFCVLVNPLRLYGEVHKEVCRWLQGTTHVNQLLLLPRAHMKSHIIACWCAWWVTKHPDTTILYVSATAELAEMQLYDIKNILTSPTYRKYWPEMVNKDEGKRDKWTTKAIAVDHPIRKKSGVRDYTIRTAGLTTNTTGWHADVIVPDDVVVPGNAYTETGREQVAAAMSQMISVRNPGGMTKACGTRYHPGDQYRIWLDQKKTVLDPVTREVIAEVGLWDTFERAVEDDGVFIWPRAERDDGKAYGFDEDQLAIIRAQYTDVTQYFAQYYNNPNNPDSNRLDETRFQYYDREKLTRVDGCWMLDGKRLNLYAGIDFAFSTSRKADFTAIAVVGMSEDGYYYVVDLVRLKTDKIEEYYRAVSALYQKWMFTKLRAEVSVAQKVIVEDLKKRINEELGGRLRIDEHRPTKAMGSKEERIAAVLEPRYENLMIYHFRGGLIPALEEELILARPQHDDLKDVLAAVVEICAKPVSSNRQEASVSYLPVHPRFGGIRF